MNLNKSIWQPEYINMDEFDLELYAGGKLFRFNRKDRSLSSPQKNYSNHYLARNIIDEEVNYYINIIITKDRDNRSAFREYDNGEQTFSKAEVIYPEHRKGSVKIKV